MMAEARTCFTMLSTVVLRQALLFEDEAPSWTCSAAACMSCCHANSQPNSCKYCSHTCADVSSMDIVSLTGTRRCPGTATPLSSGTSYTHVSTPLKCFRFPCRPTTRNAFLEGTVPTGGAPPRGVGCANKFDKLGTV
jgi:hypothetical protein